MSEQPSLFRCRYCGSDDSGPGHEERCDGRQGRIEAAAPTLEPDKSKGQARYRRILSMYRETSREAWASVSALLPAIDARIVSAIEDRFGATCDEVEQTTGFAHQTVSAQIRHMYEAGLLGETSERRPTRTGRKAIVWISVTQQR